MSDGALVRASSVSCKTMADGTLRVSFDVEPRAAQDAFSLFGAPGVPVAIARLTEAAAASDAQRETIVGGPLAKSAGMLCASEEFRRFVAETVGVDGADVALAAEFVRARCGIDSRAQLDHDPAAAEAFRQLMQDYRGWQQ